MSLFSSFRKRRKPEKAAEKAPEKVKPKKAPSRPLEWDDYYEGFSLWSVSTLLRRSYDLVSWGPPDEVIEIYDELDYNDPHTAGGFLRRALEAGVRFTTEQVMEHQCISCYEDKALFTRMAETADGIFTEEQLAELDGLVEDTVRDQLLHRAGLPTPAEEMAEFRRTMPSRWERSYHPMDLTYRLLFLKNFIWDHDD